MRTTVSRRRLAVPDRRVLPIVAIIALAVALVVVGLRSSPPVDWAQVIGNLLPGWPWW
jgi:hypothetical protein